MVKATDTETFRRVVEELRIRRLKNLFLLIQTKKIKVGNERMRVVKEGVIKKWKL